MLAQIFHNHLLVTVKKFYPGIKLCEVLKLTPVILFLKSVQHEIEVDFYILLTIPFSFKFIFSKIKYCRKKKRL